MNFKRPKFIDAMRLIALFAIIVIGTAGFVVYRLTFVEWWKPVVAGSAVGAVLMTPAARCVRRITLADDPVMNCVIAFVAASVVGYSAILGFNYAFADESSAVVESTVVVRRFEKTHKKYRRVHRRNVAAGEYRTYHIEIEFVDGFTKELSVDLHTFNRTAVGRRYDVALQRGAFGANVMKSPKNKK